MGEQNFIDYVKICCRSGDGGAGSVHFSRDRRNPKGGPDGGDGGRGGHIKLKGNRNRWTLLHLKYQKHVIGGKGGDGSKNNQKGADGEDVVIEVPLGTVAKNAETGRVEFEITRDGESRILVKGGRGGKGNTHFKSATNQTPRFAQSGEKGVESWKILELKVLADVGLVGLPNAGKSTLLSVLSAAKPKIGSYPFTTLRPNLGIVSYRDHHSFVMADIPGIIEGAHHGKGLGLRFLRHIERNSVLLFIVSCESNNIKADFRLLSDELRAYSEELMHKSRILAISKIDLLDQEMESLMAEDIPEDVDCVFISAVSGKGLQKLKDLIWKKLHDQPD
jgi:GTP-binding protein